MYVKLFTSLYAGSLRGKSDCILVFTNMLAHADSTGIVDIHPRAIAEEVGLSVERVRAAIAELESEDHDSRSPEENGKRLVLLDKHRDWGWHIVNFLKYRSIRNEDERREQNRLAQERWRSKQSKQSKPESADVSTVSQSKPKQKQDAEAINTAAARAAAAAADFKKLDPEEVTRLANRLCKATRLQNKDFIWAVAVAGESLSPGMVSELATRISAGDISKPKAYIDSAMRGECEKRGIIWAELMKLVPKPKLNGSE